MGKGRQLAKRKNKGKIDVEKRDAKKWKQKKIAKSKQEPFCTFSFVIPVFILLRTSQRNPPRHVVLQTHHHGVFIRYSSCVTNRLSSSGSRSLQGSASLLSLDGRESSKLVLGHGDPLTLLEASSSHSSVDEGGSVGVERLVSGGSSSDGLVAADNGNGSLSGLSLLEPSDDGELETELDQVEREVPDDVPNPDDTDPTTRDGGDSSESPVSETGNDGRNELGQAEGSHEGE